MAINGDVDSICDIIFKRIHLETQSEAVTVTWDNLHKLDLPPELETEKEGFIEYFRTLFSLVTGESFEHESIKKIFAKCKLDEDISHIMTGFNALLNKDFNNVDHIFLYKKFQDELNDNNLVRSVLALANNRYDTETLKLIVKTIIEIQNIYINHNIEDKVDNMAEGSEFDTIILLIEAIDGNLQSLGQL